MRSRNAKHHRTLILLTVFSAFFGFVLTGCPGGPDARSGHSNQNSTVDHDGAPKKSGSSLQIPASINAEHRELHEMLEKVIGLGGKTGEAARTVEARLREHFEKEEEYALPQLGLLQQLASGGAITDSRHAIELSDKLKADLPKMLDEHKGIVEALNALSDAAKSENKAGGVEFTERLKGHAQNEEEIMYPAAILVGEYLKLRPKN